MKNSISLNFLKKKKVEGLNFDGALRWGRKSRGDSGGGRLYSRQCGVEERGVLDLLLTPWI